MRKFLMVLTFSVLSVMIFSGFASAEIVSTGDNVEINDVPTKSFLYQAIEPWTSFDSHDYYINNYNAKHVMTELPNMTDIRIWIKEVQTTPSEPIYSHIVKIQLPNMRVVLDEKTELEVVDTLTYGINVNNFAHYSNPELIQKSVKLLDFNHKEITN